MPGIAAEPSAAEVGAFASPRVVRPQPAPAGISLLMALGVTSMVGGLMLLVAANVLIHAAAWRWGFATTLAGQGLLIGGLASMLGRLGRNSRRMNRQLNSLDRRLDDVQMAIGESASASSTSAAPLAGSGRLDLPEPTALAFT